MGLTFSRTEGLPQALAHYPQRMSAVDQGLSLLELPAILQQERICRDLQKGSGRPLVACRGHVMGRYSHSPTLLRY